jgi:uncharacterized protein (TIGR02453 family)
MITDSTLEFLRELKANNSREWFEAHRPAYQQAYGDFFDTVARLIASISRFDPVIDASSLDPKACIMRIYRDIRFSRDKTPYKTGFFAFMNKGGRKSPFGGYYLHLEPGESFCGGGVYMPDPAVLAKLRHEIDSCFPEWQAITGSADLLVHFDGIKPSGVVKRPPKGYEISNPAIEYLKYKGYYTQKFYKDEEVTSADFVATLTDAFRSVKPVIDFLNRAI